MAGNGFDVEGEAGLTPALIQELDEYAIFQIAPDGSFASWNPGVEEILGFEQDDFVGRPFSTLFLEEDQAAGIPAKVLGASRDKVRARERRWYLRKDGSLAFVSGVLMRVLGADGRFVGFTMVIHDITGQKIAEEARRRLIGKLGDLAYALDLTHTMIRDLAGTIVRWTKGAERLYGWSSAEAEGANSHTLLQTQFLEPLEQIRGQLLAQGEWHGQLTHVSKSGNRLHVASHWALRRANDASDPLVIEVNNDMTETKRFQVELEQANRALSSFSYEVAHDLQSPLRSMAMCAQLLSVTGENSLSLEQADLVRNIFENSDRLRKLVQALLQYASAQGSEGERQDLLLRTVLDGAVENLASAVAESDARIEYGSLPKVKAHESKLLQILQNLIGNALKYHRPGVVPAIRIWAEEVENGWVVHVRDNGLGIEPESLERVFTPLQRLHGPEISGTGLGLAICRRAVEAEGGRIWVDSILGQGSTFHFTLCR